MACSGENFDFALWESPGVEDGGFAWVQAGVRVEIRGLKNKAEFNGLVGRATAKTHNSAPSKRRWGVELDRGGPGVAVLEENLFRPEEPLPQNTGGFSVGDKVLLRALGNHNFLENSVGTLVGGATNGRWIVKLDSDPRKLVAVGLRHLYTYAEPDSLWQHHVALRGAVSKLCDGELANVRPLVWSFVRDDTQLALVHACEGFTISIYSMQTGSHLYNKALPASSTIETILELGLRGPEVARLCLHDEEYWADRCRVCWTRTSYGREPMLLNRKDDLANDDLFMGSSKLTFRHAGDEWVAVESVLAGWVARVWMSGLIEIFSICDSSCGARAKEKATNDFQLTNERVVNDMVGFTVLAHDDLLFISFYTSIEILAVELDEDDMKMKLVHKRQLLRDQCIFAHGSPGQISCREDVLHNTSVCAILSTEHRDAGDSGIGGGLLSLYETWPSMDEAIADEPYAVVRPWVLPLFVEVVLGRDKIFTREFCMRIMFGHEEHKLVVRSLENPSAPPLFVLQDDLVGKPETFLVCDVCLEQLFKCLLRSLVARSRKRKQAKGICRE